MDKMHGQAMYSSMTLRQFGSLYVKVSLAPTPSVRGVELTCFVALEAPICKSIVDKKLFQQFFVLKIQISNSTKVRNFDWVLDFHIGKQADHVWVDRFYSLHQVQTGSDYIHRSSVCDVNVDV